MVESDQVVQNEEGWTAHREMSPEHLRRRLDDSPMSRAQVIAVAFTVILSALDGYDVLSVTFAAPAITRDWGLGSAVLGFVLSSGLAGMALGSFLLAPLADTLGRRTMALACLVVMAAGMFFSALATSAIELSAWRIITGLSIGTCAAVINPLASEFSNSRWRPMAVALVATGYPVGGVIGGLLAAAMLQISTWHMVFFAGAIAAIVLLPLVWVFVPESPSFLVLRQREGDLTKLNKVMRRFGQPEIERLVGAGQGRRSYALVFAKGQRGTTILMAAISALMMAATYYMLSWLPQIAADAGLGHSVASLTSTLASLTGIVGGLAFGVIARFVGPVRLTGLSALGIAVSLCAIGWVPGTVSALMIAAGVCGFFTFMAGAGLYTSLTTAFTAAGRASGFGFSIGAGRVSSAVAPLFAGALFAQGWDRVQVSTTFGLSAAAAGALLLYVSARSEPRT